MKSEEPIVILEANIYQSLLKNRKLLIENIIFSHEMVDLCLEKKIISKENETEFKKSKINAERVDCIIQSLQMKPSSIFFDFCEVLMMSKQPLIAQILQESISKEIYIDIEELLKEMPILKKSLRPKDKEQLQNYITEKVKAETIKSIVTHSKENQRKESVARVSQIQQSWQFQKDIKLKDKESNTLKEQLMSVEDQLFQKENQLKSIEKELRERQKQQENELSLAANFNSVNDRELQRTQQYMNLYKKCIETVINKIKIVFPEEDKEIEKLLHQSSENQMKKYDIEKQLEIFQELIDKMLEIFNILALEKVNFETLKLEVIEVEKLLFPQREQHSPSENLTSYVKDFQKMVGNTIKSLQTKLDIQENFIFGKIPAEFVPVQYKTITIPSAEREEYTDIIKELKRKIHYLESLLGAKEMEFQQFIKHKISGEKEIFLESENVKYEENTQLNSSKPSNYHKLIESKDDKKTDIPFSYPTKHKSRQPRVLENKSKRTNALKVSSVNFF